jgi:hypothetical protein
MKKLKGKQEQHIKTVLESYEQSKNFNLLFNCILNVDTVVQMMEEKCRIKCEINQWLASVVTIGKQNGYSIISAAETVFDRNV